MKEPIYNIENDFEEDNLPTSDDFNDWVEGDYPHEQEDDYEPDCFFCAGSGEGYTPDSRCSYCNGRGTIKPKKY